MKLEIETQDIRLGFEILGTTDCITSGTTITAPGNAKFTFTGLIERRALDVPGVLQFIVDTSINIEVGILGAWLYDKTKGRASRIRINRVEVQIEEGEIKKILKEQIEHEES